MFDDNEILSYLESKFEFSLVEKLGQGSFGTVYKAIDNTDNQECAIKILDKSDMGCSLLEGRLLQQLDHPHIVKFKRVGETKSTFVIIMELMKGGTIAQLIRQRKQNQQPFTDEESSTIMKCILSAVDYMHSQNILHRDLKPENILLSDPNNLSTVKVADFGLGVQYSSEMTYRSFLQRCGTVIYMSPEQLKEQPYSKPVDLWSCGIIMYMVLSMGKHPFNQQNEIETREQYIKLLKNFPKIENWPNCTNLAIDLISRLTQYQPSNRYNAGKALNHPWITRRLEDQIPLSFEENRQIFQAKHSLIDVVKTLLILKFFKSKATKKQLKRISTRKNNSASNFVITTETTEASSPLIYAGSKSRNDSFNPIICLNSNKQTDLLDDEKSSSPLLRQRDTQSHSLPYNSPSRKKEFMIKKVGPQQSSQSPQSTSSKIAAKQQIHAPSFFKSTQHSHSSSMSHNKQHNATTGLNSSKQIINQGFFQLNNSSNDIQKKNQFQDYKTGQNNFLNINIDTAKSKIGLKEPRFQRMTSNPSQHSSSGKQDNLLPICMRIPEVCTQTQYIIYNNNNSNNNNTNFNALSNSNNLTFTFVKQMSTPNSQHNSPNTSNSPNPNTIQAQGQGSQQIPSHTKIPMPSNPASTFYNKNRQLRQRQQGSNYTYKDFDEIKDIASRTGTAEFKFKKRQSGQQLQANNNSNNNSLNSNNTSMNKNLINDQIRNTNNINSNASTNTVIATHSFNINNSPQPTRQIRKLSEQFVKSGIRQMTSYDKFEMNAQNCEDLPPSNRPLKSSRQISTFYENNKLNLNEQI